MRRRRELQLASEKFLNPEALEAAVYQAVDVPDWSTPALLFFYFLSLNNISTRNPEDLRRRKIAHEQSLK